MTLRQQLTRSLAEEGVKPRLVAHSPIAAVIGEMTADQERRHAGILTAGEQIRRWRAEDSANGQPWGDDAA